MNHFTPRNGIRISGRSLTKPRWRFFFAQNGRMQSYRSMGFYSRADCARQRDLALNDLVQAGLKVMNAQTVFDNPERAKADIAAGIKCAAVGFPQFLATQIEEHRFWKDVMERQAQREAGTGESPNSTPAK